MLAVDILVALLFWQAPRTVPAGIEIVTDADGNVIERRGPPGATAGTRFPDTDRFIVAARQSATEFTGQLPDFLCDQITIRKESARGPLRWRSHDRVTAEVLYAGGKESYRNVRVNGKVPKGGSPDVSGTWSTGEYGTVLRDLLSVGTAAAFERPRETSIGGVAARMYEYKVARGNSHWRIEYESYKLYPAFEGAVWFEPRDHRVLRMEMMARDIPRDYPLDVIETTVDYGVVEIGRNRYLLPVASECLACVRGTTRCTRNETQFRNYRKFTAESTVTTTDSTITFEGEKRR